MAESWKEHYLIGSKLPLAFMGRAEWLDLTEVDLRPFRVGRDTGGPILDLLEPVRDQPPVTLPKPIIK